MFRSQIWAVMATQSYTSRAPRSRRNLSAFLDPWNAAIARTEVHCATASVFEPAYGGKGNRPGWKHRCSKGMRSSRSGKDRFSRFYAGRVPAARKYRLALGRNKKYASATHIRLCTTNSNREWKALRATWNAIQASASQRAQLLPRSI